MSDQVASCPQCQGLVNLPSSCRFVQCASCGSHYIIRRDGAGQVSLEPPGPTFLDTATMGPIERAARLAPQIADGQEEVQLRQAEVDATTTAYWRGRLGLQRVIAGAQNGTYASGLLSALAAFLAMFALRSDERLYGTAIAVLIALVAWAFRHEWRDEEKLGQRDLSGALAAVTEAREAYHASVNRLEDLVCEQSICVGLGPARNEVAQA